MFSVKIIGKNKKVYWYENVKYCLLFGDGLRISWWSDASQEYIYTIIKRSEIKKIKIKNKG